MDHRNHFRVAWSAFAIRAALIALGSRAFWSAPKEGQARGCLFCMSPSPAPPGDQESTACLYGFACSGPFVGTVTRSGCFRSHPAGSCLPAAQGGGTPPGGRGTVVGTPGVAVPCAGRVEPLPSAPADPPPGDMAVLLVRQAGQRGADAGVWCG